MGFIFGGSTTENEKRIERLEDNVDSLNTHLDTVQKRAERRAQEAEEMAERAATIAHAANAIHTNDVTAVEDMRSEVETLDTPKIGWKATEDSIVKLLIPEGATVVHPEGKTKKRTDEAIPLALYEIHKKERYYNYTKTVASDDPSLRTGDVSLHDPSFQYTIGERATPDRPLNTNVASDCASGIHFFITKRDAADWHYK